MKGGAKVLVEGHRHEGVFIARGKEDSLVTRNLVPGVSVYGEKRISTEVAEGEKVEYRVWNPFRSKLAAAILAGLDNIYIKPGAGAGRPAGIGGPNDGPRGRARAPDRPARPPAAGTSSGDGWQQRQACGAAAHPRALPAPPPCSGSMQQRMRSVGSSACALLPALIAPVVNPHGAGSRLLYLGGASGTSVSHCSDLVGPEGTVYAVEFSHRSGRDLVNMAKQRPNVIPIIEV